LLPNGLPVLPVLPWTLEAADRYGKIAAHLQQTGQPIGEMDTQIAAHALALVLRLEDWMT